MNRTGRRTGDVAAGPERVGVPARADGGPEIARGDVGSDDTRGTALHKQDVIRTCCLFERVGQVHDTAFDGQLATARLETGVAQIGVLKPGRGAARKEAHRGVAGRSGTAKAVRGTTEVVDKGVVPIAREFTDDAHACAAGVDAVVEVLRRRR